jgi:hypothetical protein
MIFVIYYDFLRFSQNKYKKEQNHWKKPAKEVMCLVSRVQQVQTDSFIVYKGNADSSQSLGGKNNLFAIILIGSQNYWLGLILI